MLAAESFDPRLIWDQIDDPAEDLEAGAAVPAESGGVR
jgi:hypothetical protein